MNLTKTQLALAGAALAGIVAATTAGTMAVFTDQDTITNNAFSNKTLDLTLGTATALVSFSGMVPGDRVTSQLSVTNGATSADLRYSIASTVTVNTLGLKDQLVLTIRTEDTGVGNTFAEDGNRCDDFTGGDATPVYSGDLDNADDLGKLVGDAATGNDTGDRAMASNTVEYLCFRVELPQNTGNAFKGATATATFTFDSEQTANNA